MKVFAISDLHLSVNNPKPMDIFGCVWDGYVEKIFDDWKKKVSFEDIVLLAGDFSWAMKLEDAKADFDLLKDLPGKKVIIRGNHDYWWSAISKVRASLPKDFYAVQNDAIKFGNIIICGTRGWNLPQNDQFQTPEDEKIFKREVLRLDMTLANAVKSKESNDKIVCMIHYPPVDQNKNDSEFSLLLEKYSVDFVIFGHIHGKNNFDKHFIKNGIEYFLTSADQLKNQLALICEI